MSLNKFLPPKYYYDAYKAPIKLTRVSKKISFPFCEQMADHSLWKWVCMLERFMTSLSYATVGPSRSLKVAIVVIENIRFYSFPCWLRGFTVEIVMGNSKRKMCDASSRCLLENILIITQHYFCSSSAVKCLTIRPIILILP